MRFAPSAEQTGFAASLGDLLASSDVPAVARSWAAGDPALGRKLWRRVAELGVLELHEHPVELVLAFEQLGRYAVPGPYVEAAAVLPALGIGEAESMATVAMPTRVPYALDAAAAEQVYVVQDGVLSTASVTEQVPSVDSTRLLARVVPERRLAAVDASNAFDRGALAAAAQICGAGRAVLDRSVEYAKQRRQFGTPIGRFQAVKHQLADVLVGIELSRPLLFGAALSLTARDISAAKVACTDAAYRATRVALQVHGAIGYTAEYDLSLELTKVRALVSAWGTQSFHRRRIWEAIKP